MQINTFTKNRTFLLIVFCIILLAVCTASIILALKNNSLTYLLTSAIFITALSPILAYYFKRSSNIEEELEQLREESKTIEKRLADNPKEGDILGTIQVQLNEIKEYYLLNRNQATSSYTVSTIAVFAGFVILVFGVVLLFLNSFKDPQLATITGVNGLLLQFIGGSFFFLYRKTHNQLNYFYNQLLSSTLYNMLSNKQHKPGERE